MEKDRLLLFSGDIHGELKTIVWKVTIQLKIKHASLIICGDFGAGFGKPKYLDLLYKSVEKRLEENDITVYAIRGNHDDPEYFDGKHNYPRLKLLKDHEVVEIEGKKIYPIGGAHSIDRKERWEENDKLKHFGSSKRVWWENEWPEEIYENLPEKVDIVVSHEAPLTFEPVVVRKTADNDLELWKDILKARKYLDYVLNNVNTCWWIHGHYHKSTSGNYAGVMYRGLAIEEIFYIPYL